MINFTLGFVVGIIAGGLVGMFLMCCLVVNKDEQ